VIVNDSDLQRDYQRAVALRGSQGRSNCPRSEAIEALAAGEGAERDRLTTLDHVMACPYCQREFELLRAIHAAGAPGKVVPLRAWYAVAATALLAVALTIFTVNRDSTTMRGEDADSVPALVSPRGAVDAATARQFAWRPFPDAAQYRFELLGSDGQLRASASVVDTTWTLADSVSIVPGETLQWTVEAILPDARRIRSPVSEFRVR
jgi:hypothetical protein